MNSQAWIRYYRQNQQNRPEPDWNRRCAIPPRERAELARSLSHFQLGESGGGRCLERLGKRLEAERTDPGHQEALRLFVAEEAEHARLLAELVRYLGGALVTRHWTHRLFRLVRQAAGLHFEIQVLVTAELAGTAYYESVHGATTDETVRETISLLLRDEARHVAYHLDRLRDWQAGLLPVERTLWELQFQALFMQALLILWADHGRCLKALGLSQREYFRRARRHGIDFLRKLEPRAARAAAIPRETPKPEATVNA
ncbi:MAG: ferritin-like domain-containing protein [Verrucomicrobiota bacterium]